MNRITLEDARKLTNDALAGYIKIVEEIKSAARKGEHYVDVLSKDMTIQISSKLERDGFDISHHIINNINIDRIFWGY
jgi:phosphosulfolactate synthase (CoM biosynthesis protein A)